MATEEAQRNRQVNEACVELVKQYAHDGMACCVLKGQGNLVNYPEDMRECRTPGDIDVWCKTIDPSGIDIAVSDIDGNGAHYQKYHGKEAVIEYVKMLWRQTPSNSPCVGGESRPDGKSIPLSRGNEGVFPIPTVSFNAVYQLCHIYRHLFDEGIGLRQLLDYYFVLRALHIEQDSLADRTDSMAQWAEGMGVAVRSNAEIMHTLSRFGMKKFASATMYVLHTVFAMPDEYLICQPNEKEGKFLLNEIMQAGNFGKYDERISRSSKSFMGFKVSDSMAHAIEKTKHNLRLLTHYPEEVMWEPIFRIYHFLWRKLRLWRF